MTEQEIRKDKANYEICACGHDEFSHTAEERDPETGEISADRVPHSCVVAGWHCDCETFRPVLRVSALFAFRRPSRGSAGKHALVKGSMLLLNSGGEIEWLNDGPTCDKCGTQGMVMPYRQAADFGAMTDLLLCRVCSEGVPDDEAKRQSRGGLTI